MRVRRRCGTSINKPGQAASRAKAGRAFVNNRYGASQRGTARRERLEDIRLSRLEKRPSAQRHADNGNPLRRPSMLLIDCHPPRMRNMHRLIAKSSMRDREWDHAFDCVKERAVESGRLDWKVAPLPAEIGERPKTAGRAQNIVPLGNSKCGGSGCRSSSRSASTSARTLFMSQWLRFRVLGKNQTLISHQLRRLRK